MKTLKIGLYAFGAVALVLAGVVAFVVATFDPNAYKPQIVRLVKDKTGRTLAIDGDIGLKIFPKIGASVGRMSLSEHDSAKEFAGVDGAQVYLALMPLLSKEVVVDEVRLDGLRASLVKHKDGTTNFSDLTGGGQTTAGETPTPAAPQPESRSPIKLDISGVRVTRSRLEWRDESTSNDLVLELNELKTGHLAERTRAPVSLDLAIKGTRPKLDLRAKLNGTLTLDLAGQHYGVEGLTMQVDGDAVNVSGLTVELKGDVDAEGIRRSAKVNGLSLQMKGKLGADVLEFSLTAPKLDVSAEKAGGDSVQLSAKLSGPDRNGNVVVKLSGVEGSAKALKITALTLDADVKQKDNAVKATLSTPILGNLEAKTFELSKIAADLTLTSPSIPQKTVKLPLAASVRADLTREHVDADLTAKLDESTIKAKLGMARFAAPAYQFDVNIDQLNVDRYLPPKQKTTEAKPAEPQAKQPEQPIDFSPLKALDLDGSVKVGSLQANNIKATNVRADIKAKDGRLSVEPMLANLYQGSLKGSAALDANRNQIALKQVLAGISIGPLLKDAIQKDILEGHGSVVLDLTTAGNTVTAFKRALNGSARMDLKDGAIKGVDLAGALRNVKVKLGAGDAEQGGSQTEKTDFSELGATFTIKNGVAHNSDLNAKSPFLRLSGEGDVNIPEDSLDYTVKAAVVSTMAGQGGKERAELKGLTLPVRVYGPYADLKYKLQFSQMFSGASKEALKDTAKQMLKESTKGQLEDLSKKLLGGKGDGQNGQTAGGNPSQPAAPAKKPEDQVKEKLKGLFR